MKEESPLGLNGGPGWESSPPPMGTGVIGRGTIKRRVPLRGPASFPSGRLRTEAEGREIGGGLDDNALCEAGPVQERAEVLEDVVEKSNRYKGMEV
jgi:hypothetical protein